MSLRLFRVKATELRVATAALLFAMLSFAAGLSAAPQLHERLHDAGHQAPHDCAVTLLSSGGVSQSECEPSSIAPQPAPAIRVLGLHAMPELVAHLAFTRLEHAPPALS